MAIDQTPPDIVQPTSSADREKTSDVGESAPDWAQVSDRPKYDGHQRGRGRGRGGMNNAGPRKEWHEEWKDLEDYIHPGGYNPNTPVTDRVRSAAMGFARNLTLEMNVIRRDDFRGQNIKKPLKPRPPYANYAKAPTVVHSDEEIQDLLQSADAEKNEKLFDFCDNPEKMVPIFLSSYMIDQGIYYVSFSDELKNSLKVADLAIVQTSKIAKALPDALHNALSPSFSSKVTPEEDAFTRSLQEQGVEFVSIDVEIAAVKDVMEDNVDAEDGGWAFQRRIGNFPREDPFYVAGVTAPILSVTHTTGVVESSTRRVTAIVHPADAASSELSSKFSKIVLSPWPDARVNHPIIEETSKGHGLAEDEGSAPGAHNPWKDDIAILVEDETAAVLKVGMGLEGMFVQMAGMWCLRKLVATLPSYYILSDELHPDF
ncbi:hypothetical protein BDZ89DRAFT_1067419 [Hymenopellis radicata]|nr:hypothetical protein BDZ89DRAFT_1067419 [Hymenopellis radicata]